MSRHPILVGAMVAVLWSTRAGGQQAPADGAAIFSRVCAPCHASGADQRAPGLESLRQRTPRSVLNAMLLSNAMRVVTTRLTNDERRAVAEYVTGKALGGDATGAQVGRCERPAPMGTLDREPAWNGWGAGLSNARFQPASQAGLTADLVPRLKLKWALGFPDAAQAWSQPAVAGGRLFVGSQSGAVYATNATTGCIIWTFTAGSGVRTGIVVGPPSPGRRGALLYFSDMAGYSYAVAAETGQLVWKQQVEAHPYVRLTGTPALYANRLYVPTSSFEESLAPELENCCTFRGSIVALDAATGTILWRTYTIAERPREQGPAAKGKPNWGPSGGAVWSSPTVDARRGVLYVATGNNYTPPATAGTDAVIAMDLKTGKVRWTRQLTEGDVWNTTPEARAQSPDFDFGSSAILTTGPGGRDVIVAPQKSGIGWALDPDREGATVWQYRAGRGGAYGGIEWGAAVDGRLAFLPVSDVHLPDPGGLHAVDLQTGERVWFAAPQAARCGTVNRNCNSGQPAAATAIPGIVFSGAVDGMLRAYSSRDGTVVWEFNTNQEFQTLNGVPSSGGSINGPGPTVAGGMLYVNSGYGLSGRPGNVLLAFGPE